MAEAIYPEKEPLTSTIMFLDRLRTGLLLRFNVLHWVLEYESLEYGGSYIRYALSLNWFLIFTKRRKSVTIFLLTKECKTIIQGFVVHQLQADRRKHSVPVVAKEVGDKRYKIEIPSALIHDERNEILKENGCLVLGFMFDTRRLMCTQVGLHLDEELETNSFMAAYEKRLFTDFIIRANGEEFHVHKAILAARSMYFYRNMHRRTNEVTLSASSKSVQSVIRYLYSGELPLLTLADLIDVFEISVKLFITSLMDQCTLYFLDIMNEDNVGRIRDVAIKTGAQALVKAANQAASIRLSKMDTSGPKLFLNQGSIERYKSISQRTWAAGTCISCEVHNYSELDNSIYYCLTHTVADSDFMFKVLKKPNFHFYQLHCHLTDFMIFYILYDEAEYSVGIPSRHTEYGYWVEVPKTIVCHPRNKYLHRDNSLVVQFHYEWNVPFTRRPYALTGNRTLRDEELFSQDMMKLYEMRESTGDFSITVQGEQFAIHKFVFDVRTMWFEKNPKSSSWKQISIKGEPLVMDKVIRYMYSGVLEEMHLEGMLQVLEIAVTLEMEYLIQTIRPALMKLMTKENALKILKTASKAGLTELANHAAGCLPELDTSPEKNRKRSKNRRKKRR